MRALRIGGTWGWTASQRTTPMIARLTRASHAAAAPIWSEAHGFGERRYNQIAIRCAMPVRLNKERQRPEHNLAPTLWRHRVTR